MIKDLIKIANKLDSLGLTKEADMLDKFLKFAAENPNLFEEYTGPIEPIENIDFKKLILEKSKEELRDIFKQSCNQLLEESRKILGSSTDDFLYLLDPRIGNFTEKEEEELEEAKEGSVEELSNIYIKYDPTQLISAAKEIKYDNSMNFGLRKAKDKVRSLLDSFDRIADQIFHGIK